METSGLEAAWETYWSPLFADSTASTIRDAARSWALQQDVGAIVRGVRAFHDRRDLSHFVAQWERPLIGISGEFDLTPPPSALRAIATGPRRTFHLVRGAGHYVNLEQPNAFNALLAATIDRHHD